MIEYRLPKNLKIALTIRIRQSAGGPWLSCPLLSAGLGWARVDDGRGPLWVRLDQVHWQDRGKIRLVMEAESRKN